MITRFIIAGLLFVTLSSGLAYAFDSEDGPEPVMSEPAPGEEAPSEEAPVEAPAPEEAPPEQPPPAQ